MNNTVGPADPVIDQPDKVEIIDDTPDKVHADLRKFNKAEAQVNKVLAEVEKYPTIENAAEKDLLITAMKDAKKVETLIENKRKDLVAPYNAEVKRINECAKSLTERIAPAINTGKNLVLAFDKAEEKRLVDERTAARKIQIQILGFIQEGFDAVLDDDFTCEGVTIRGIDIVRLDNIDWADEVAMQIKLVQRKKEAALKNKLEASDFFGDDTETETIKEEIEAVKQTAAAPVHVPSFGGGGSFTKTKGTTKKWTYKVTDVTAVPKEYLMIDEKKVKAAIAACTRFIGGLEIYQEESLSLR